MMQGCSSKGGLGGLKPLPGFEVHHITVHCILKGENPNICIYALNNIPPPHTHTLTLVYAPELLHLLYFSCGQLVH